MARTTIILLGIICALYLIQLSDAEMSHPKDTKPLGKGKQFRNLFNGIVLILCIYRMKVYILL